MNKEQIKEFLKNKKGYLKEGGKRLRDILIKKGFNVTTSLCKEALKEARSEYNLDIKQSKDLKILLYDIETAYGLARVWRPGYKLRVSYEDFIKHPSIICISYKWKGSDEIHSVRWDSNQNDKIMLEVFIKYLNEADEIVAHNGDNFDLPWIRTRALFNNLEIRPKYKSIDTLKIARSKFRFPSNKLDDLGDYLGVGRKIKTNRELWVDSVCNKNLDSLNKMVEYCNQDVLLLEDVYNKLITQELPKSHAGVLNNNDKLSSPITGSKNIELVQTTTTKAGTIKHLMKCLDTNRFFEMSDTNYKKFLQLN